MLCIAGKNQIAVDILEYVINRYSGLNIVALTNKNDVGVDTWQPSFIKKCKEHNVAIMSLEEVYRIKDLIFLSVEYDTIISPHLFKSTYLYNVHFSALPKYKGMYTSIWPILNGETHSGVTLHLIDSGIDTGGIIDQTVFPIGTNDTAHDLYFSLLKYGTELVKKNFENLLKNDFLPVIQEATNASYYSRKSINFKNLAIDFCKCAIEVKNQIRAFYFPEYQVPVCFGKSIRNCEILEQRSSAKPGTILFISDQIICVSTIDYNVRLYVHWE